MGSDTTDLLNTLGDSEKKKTKAKPKKKNEVAERIDRYRVLSKPIDERTGHVADPEVISFMKGKEEHMGFRATPDQVRFRDLAMNLSKKGYYFRTEWFEATRKPGYRGVEISENIWIRWVDSQKNFLAWFFDEFPLAQEVSEAEMRMMDSRFWHGIRNAREGGEEWAYRQYARVRFEKSGSKKTQENPAELDELRKYFKSGGGERWRTHSHGG